MFVKVIRKIIAHFRALIEGAIIEEMPEKPLPNETCPLENGTGNDGDITSTKTQVLPIIPLDQELREGADAVNKDLRDKQRALIDALPLDQYELPLSAPSWVDAEAQIQRHTKSKSKAESQSNGTTMEHVPTVSVKGKKSMDSKRKGETAEQVYNEEIGDREAKRLKKGMSSKRT